MATLSAGSILFAYQEVTNKSATVPELDLPIWLDGPVPTASDRADGNLAVSPVQVAHVDGWEPLSARPASLAPDAMTPIASLAELNAPEGHVALTPEIQIQDMHSEKVTHGIVNENNNEVDAIWRNNIDVTASENNGNAANERQPLPSLPKIRSELLHPFAHEHKQTSSIKRIAKQPDRPLDRRQPFAPGWGTDVERKHPSGLLSRAKGTYVSLPINGEGTRNRLGATRGLASLAEQRHSSIELPRALRPTLP